MQFIILGAGFLMLMTLIGGFRQTKADEQPEDYDRLKEEVWRLRERVRTLERIITDPDETLSRKFRDL